MIRKFSAVAAAAVLAAAAAAPAAAVDQSKGHPGFCTGGTGVTVVVDFQKLGGTTIVRCDPQSGRGTGLDALKNAGFQIGGVQRWGEAFVCRIENRPAPDEDLPIRGDEHYREPCVDTPPATGYWSYWHAGNNCAWEYSQWGVKNRDFVPGGFEGWSFSLNATADTNPVPRIAPVRPGTEGGQCATAAETPPLSDNPAERQQPRPAAGGTAGAPGQASAVPSGTASAAPGAGTGLAAPGASRALPPPKPRPHAPDPAKNVEFTGGEHAPDVVQAAEASSSSYAPWAAGLAVVLLAVAACWTALRRRRARNG